jgi:hypothetical protein
MDGERLTAPGFAGTTLALSGVIGAMFWPVRLGRTVTATLLRDVACLPFPCRARERQELRGELEQSVAIKISASSASSKLATARSKP